jgi:hypothetical protein
MKNILFLHDKNVYFGASGYSDFTIHKDEKRKKHT